MEPQSVQESAYSSMTPSELVFRLLDRAEVDLYCARDAIERWDCETANRSLLHAQDIFRELQAMMRSEDPLAQQVSSFLGDVAELLFFANLYKDTGRIDDVLPFIERLKIIYGYALGAGKRPTA